MRITGGRSIINAVYKSWKNDEKFGIVGRFDEARSKAPVLLRGACHQCLSLFPNVNIRSEMRQDAVRQILRKGDECAVSGSINMLSMDAGTKAIDALWQRSNVISDNVANADTPGYQQKSVSFEDQLSQAISDGSLSAGELDSVSPQVQVESGTISSSDSNGVDMETQMVELMRNQLQYSYLTRGVSDQLSMLKTAASGGEG
ncbi:flagellar basal body rod protein FlgB [Ethanoligenens harbinense]|nr:flagellar basal body rod protein FlgB [Ethanoligenens harbinense]